MPLRYNLIDSLEIVFRKSPILLGKRGLLKILCHLIMLKGNVDFLGAPHKWEGDKRAMKGFSTHAFEFGTKAEG